MGKQIIVRSSPEYPQTALFKDPMQVGVFQGGAGVPLAVQLGLGLLHAGFCWNKC